MEDDDDEEVTEFSLFLASAASKALPPSKNHDVEPNSVELLTMMAPLPTLGQEKMEAHHLASIHAQVMEPALFFASVPSERPQLFRNSYLGQSSADGATEMAHLRSRET